jgi:hypothetical protein
MLGLTRWSRSEERSKPWASLSFITWEGLSSPLSLELLDMMHDCCSRSSANDTTEMVLFHCTFVCLKARSVLTVDVKPKEFTIRKEFRLFQALVLL